jgi:hypothetical protein
MKMYTLILLFHPQIIVTFVILFGYINIVVTYVTIHIYNQNDM